MTETPRPKDVQTAEQLVAEALGDDYAMSEDRVEDARRHASFQDQALNPRVVRRRKAGDWIPVGGDERGA